MKGLKLLKAKVTAELLIRDVKGRPDLHLCGPSDDHCLPPIPLAACCRPPSEARSFRALIRSVRTRLPVSSRRPLLVYVQAEPDKT